MNRTSTALAGLSAACFIIAAYLVYLPAALVVAGAVLAGAAWLTMYVDEDGVQ